MRVEPINETLDRPESVSEDHRATPAGQVNDTRLKRFRDVVSSLPGLSALLPDVQCPLPAGLVPGPAGHRRAGDRALELAVAAVGFPVEARAVLLPRPDVLVTRAQVAHRHAAVGVELVDARGHDAVAFRHSPSHWDRRPHRLAAGLGDRRERWSRATPRTPPTVGTWPCLGVGVKPHPA